MIKKLVVLVVLLLFLAAAQAQAQGPWCCQCSTCAGGHCWAVFSRQRESPDACESLCRGAGCIGTDAYTSRYACGTHCVPHDSACNLLRYYLPLVLK